MLVPTRFDMICFGYSVGTRNVPTLPGFNGTVRDLVSNVFNYPTLAECYKLAAVDCTHQLEQRKM